MKLRRGEAIRWAGTGSILNPASTHIFVCVDVVNTDVGDEYILVPICSSHAKSDCTCSVGPDEYAELKHASYAAYYQARFATEKVLKINAASIKLAKRTTPQLWFRIRAGVLASDETPPKIIKALQTIVKGEQAAKAEKAAKAQGAMGGG